MHFAAKDCRPGQHALYLVAGTGLLGVAASIYGALQWGLIGLSLGIIGTWLLFILGLFALYQRVERKERRGPVPTIATPADVAGGPPAKAPAS